MLQSPAAAPEQESTPCPFDHYVVRGAPYLTVKGLLEYADHVQVSDPALAASYRDKAKERIAEAQRRVQARRDIATEIEPIIHDKAAEDAFLIGLWTRTADTYLAAAEAFARKAVGARGLTAVLMRMRSRAWVRRSIAAKAKIEMARLGL